MRWTSVSAVLTFGLIATASAAKITLDLDYSGKASWAYAVAYTAQCVSQDKEGSSTKSTDITATLDGKVSTDKGRLDITVKDLVVKSDLYDEAGRADLAAQIAKTPYNLALIDGYPMIDTSVDFSSEGLPEWNLYLQLARLVPDLSDKPVKKGMEWERTVALPVPSAQGMVDCEVYRMFKVDRLSAKKDTAYIVWEFRYGATGRQKMESSSLKYAPVAGKGKGTAAIDIAGKQIIYAEVEFETPVATVDGVKVSWKEKASIKRTAATSPQ